MDLNFSFRRRQNRTEQNKSPSDFAIKISSKQNEDLKHENIELSHRDPSTLKNTAEREFESKRFSKHLSNYMNSYNREIVKLPEPN